MIDFQVLSRFTFDVFWGSLDTQAQPQIKLEPWYLRDYLSISYYYVNMLLYQILAYTIRGKKMKKLRKNNKFKLSAPKWNEEFELPDGSFSVSDIKDCFEYILRKKHGEKTDNPSIKVYVNKIENRITFKMKRILSQTFNAWNNEITWSNKSKITKDENGKDMPHLDITEVILVHYNIADNNYQQDSRVLYKFVINKSFGQLLDISPRNFVFLQLLTENFYILKYGLLIKILIG